jgi:hypothetical protein
MQCMRVSLISTVYVTGGGGGGGVTVVIHTCKTHVSVTSLHSRVKNVVEDNSVIG